MIRFDVLIYQGVAQLVARPAGGREVAGSSPVTLTMKLLKILVNTPPSWCRQEFFPAHNAGGCPQAQRQWRKLI